MADDKPVRWTRAIFAPLRQHARDVLALAAFINVLALAVPVFTLQVYDRVIFFAGVTTLEGLVIGMVLVLVFDFALRQTRARLLQRVALRIDVDTSRMLFDKLMSVPLRTLESRPTVYWQTLFRDLEVVRNTFSGASALLVVDLPFAILFLAVIYVIAGPIAWIFPVILGLFLLLSWRSGRVLDRRARAENVASLGRDGLVAEVIAGRTTIKALDLTRPMQALWEEKHAATIRESLARGVHTDTYINLGAMLTVATTVAITTVGALAIIDQRMSLGSLIAANMLSGRIVAAFNQLFMSWKTYVMCRQSMGRLGEAFALAEERRESAITLARPRGDVAFEKVVFGYADGQKPVIDEVSLKLAAGGLHGVVGRNGSGKTTLLKLLAGLYAPLTGRVLIDEADIAQFTRAELSRYIGYVPQECVLFSGTIRDNIAKSLPEATDEAIVLAAKRAGAHGFIVDLPDGYATQIGEAGGRLSSGQRQRLSIARALVGDPPVLLLDEPTSFLDRFAEQDLKDTLAELARDHTLIVVTHSGLVLSICTTITALEGGRVVLTGPGAEVLPRLMRPRSSPQPVARPA